MSLGAGLKMIGLFTVLLGGCGPPPPPEMPNPPPTAVLASTKPAVNTVDVDQAIQVAVALRAAPTHHEAILQEHALTPEAWDAMMVDIASDPQASQRYAAALEAPVTTPAEAQAPAAAE